MGNEVYTHDSDALHNFGITSIQERKDCTKAMSAMNVTQFNPSFNHQSGAILSDPSWSVYMNDAWVLGTCHAAAEAILQGQPPQSIQIALPPQFLEDPRAYIWNSKGPHYLRVTGREFIGYLNFGYQLVETKIRDTLFLQLSVKEEIKKLSEKSCLANAGFLEYKRLIMDPRYNNVEALVDFIQNNIYINEVIIRTPTPQPKPRFSMAAKLKVPTSRVQEDMEVFLSNPCPKPSFRGFSTLPGIASTK
jgi:hypothetical protein